MRILLVVLMLLAAGSAGAVGIWKVGSGATVTVGTGTPTLLDDPSVSDNEDRFLQVCNLEGTNPIFIGDEAVTVGGGMILPVGYCYATGVVLRAKAKSYAIASVSTAVRVQEQAAK